MQRYVLWVTGLVGLAVGVRWAMLTPPHPDCSGADGFCELQHVYAAQFTKIVGSACAFHALASLVAYTIPGWLHRREQTRRGRAWAAENRLRAASQRIPLSRDDIREQLVAAAPPALPAAALTASRRSSALRPRNAPISPPAVPVDCTPITQLGLPPAALSALRAVDATIDAGVEIPGRRFTRAEPALRPRRVA